jgi:hypothetical protein
VRWTSEPGPDIYEPGREMFGSQDDPDAALNPEALLNLPCKVENLIIQGNTRTKKELIERELRAALKARTHELLALELGKARRSLEDLDVFRSSLFEVDLHIRVK